MNKSRTCRIDESSSVNGDRSCADVLWGRNVHASAVAYALRVVTFIDDLQRREALVETRRTISRDPARGHAGASVETPPECDTNRTTGSPRRRS
jgi:hypothetical protein